MSLDFNKGGSRYGRTTKRKKTNMVYNILIGVVFIFIIVLGSSLFFGKNDPTTDTENQLANDQQQNESDENTPTEDEKAEEEEAARSEEEEEPEEEESQEEDENEENENDSNSETEVSENSDDPNVIKTMTNAGWGPVGTSQSEPHTSVYDENHIDWQEKLNAVHAATGLNSGDYTLMFLGNGGSEHHAVASIRNKSTGENFKIYLEWVTNEGWKPTKVEQVKAL